MNSPKTLNHVYEHYDELKQVYNMDRIVGIFCQGSHNYKLDYEGSDVDTKAILLPSFKDIVFNKSPISTTHVRSNNEHIDLKDMRLYFQTFRKQNINFVEILFTDYFFLNRDYEQEFKRLIAEREKIAHYNPYATVKATKGMALEKYYAIQKDYPSQTDVIAQYGYAPKQLHHLLRFLDFLPRYINEEPYEDILIPEDRGYLIDVKCGAVPLDVALKLAESSIKQITDIADDYCSKVDKNSCDKEVDELLDDVQFNIMTLCMQKELVNK